MTAGRHHVLEQGLGPKTNGVYTWWPLFVISGLAQASYTVQRIEAQTNQKNQKKQRHKKNITKQTKQEKTKKTKNNKTTKTTKKHKKKQKNNKNQKINKDLATSLLTAIFGQISFCCCFFWSFWFVWFLCFLFGKFRKFSEMVDFSQIFKRCQ